MSDADEREGTTKKHSPMLWIGGCIGCAVIVVIGLAVAGWMGLKWFIAQGEAMVVEFEEKGFVRDSGQMITVTSDVNEKIVYFGQMVKIQAPVNTDVALVAQMGELYNEVHGDFYFRGQMLTIGSKAIIHGDLDVDCQMVTIQGQVMGEVRGVFQQKIDSDGNTTTGSWTPFGDRTEDANGETDAVAGEAGALETDAGAAETEDAPSEETPPKDD